MRTSSEQCSRGRATSRPAPSVAAGPAWDRLTASLARNRATKETSRRLGDAVLICGHDDAVPLRSSMASCLDISSP